jgi:hypothetical protein
MTFEVFLEENDMHSVLGELSIRKRKLRVKKKGVLLVVITYNHPLKITSAASPYGAG